MYYKERLYVKYNIRTYNNKNNKKMENIQEIFKTVKGFPNYQVSNKGRVLSLARKQPAYLTLSQDAMGYQHVRLYNPANPKATLIKVHRLVANHFVYKPKSDEFFEVNHLDGNKQNNADSNLQWCTKSENIKHAYATGLRKDSTRVSIIKRGVPVKITFKDGTERYYPTIMIAGLELKTRPQVIMEKIKRGTFGRLGFKAETCTKEDFPLTFEEMLEKLISVEERLIEYRAEVFPSRYANV